MFGSGFSDSFPLFASVSFPLRVDLTVRHRSSILSLSWTRTYTPTWNDNGGISTVSRVNLHHHHHLKIWKAGRLKEGASLTPYLFNLIRYTLREETIGIQHHHVRAHTRQGTHWYKQHELRGPLSSPGSQRWDPGGRVFPYYYSCLVCAYITRIYGCIRRVALTGDHLALFFMSCSLLSTYAAGWRPAVDWRGNICWV